MKAKRVWTVCLAVLTLLILTVLIVLFGHYIFLLE